VATAGHVQKASCSGQKLNESASTRRPRVVLWGNIGQQKVESYISSESSLEEVRLS